MKRLDTEYRNREKKICIGKLSNANFEIDWKASLKWYRYVLFKFEQKLKEHPSPEHEIEKKKKENKTISKKRRKNRKSKIDKRV